MDSWGGWTGLGLALGFAQVLACAEPQGFLCGTDEDCSGGGAGGRCETSGYCSFGDTACPTGQRYGQHAAGALAGDCVPANAEATSAAATSSPPCNDCSTSTGSSPAATDTAEPESTGERAESGSSPFAETTTSMTGAQDSSSDGGVATTTGEQSVCPTFFDDFQAAPLAPAWMLEPDAPFTVEDGALKLEVPAGVADFYEASISEFDLSGGAATVHLADVPSASVTQQAMRLYNNSGNAVVELLVENGAVLVRVYVEGMQVSQTEPAQLDTRRWLRARAVADGAIVLEFSDDGRDYEVLTTVPAPFNLSGTSISLGGGNWSPLATPQVVAFDSLSVCATE